LIWRRLVRRLWSTGTLEKVVLMDFLWAIYAQVLPESGRAPSNCSSAP
jgi:hypothetical protein